MSENQTPSGNRWEPAGDETQPVSAAAVNAASPASATAVAESPAPEQFASEQPSSEAAAVPAAAWSPAAAGGGRGLKQRWNNAGGGARWVAGGLAGAVVLLGLGGGGFALGRATAPDGASPSRDGFTGFDRGARFDRDGDGDFGGGQPGQGEDFPGGAPGLQGQAPGGTAPDSGTGAGAGADSGTGTGTNSSWYVVDSADTADA